MIFQFLCHICVITFLLFLPSKRVNAEERDSSPHSNQKAEQEKTKTVEDSLLVKQQIKTITNTQDTNKETQSEKIQRHLAEYTLALVGVTLLLAGFSLWQVFISRDTAKRQLRAYVYITCDTPWDKLPKGVITEFTIRNAGQTPAHEVDYWMYHEIRDYPLNSELSNVRPNDDTVHQTILHRGQQFNVHPHVQFSESEIEQIFAKTKAYYFWGQVHYKDIFRVKRVTEFAFMATGGKGERVMFCEKGNKAT